MVRKITFVLLTVMIFECHGHLSILGDIISKTSERVHSTVDGVAGAVLGGVSHGLNLNFGGHFGFNRHQQNVQPKEQGETIVVVIEEPSGNEDRPNNNDYRPMHHDYQPNHNPHNHNEPAPNPNPGYNDPSQGPYNNDRENHRNPVSQQNNNFNPNARPHDWSNGNENNGYNEGSQINYNKPPNDNLESNNFNHQNSYNENSNQFNKGPSTGPFTTPKTTEQSSSPKNDATEKPSDDVPLFVPLDPNQYVYGGENINITAPKRDTGKNNQAESKDEDYAIDVRFKDQ